MKRKKTLISILTGLCLSFTLATLFTACNENPTTESGTTENESTENLEMESVGLEYTLNKDGNTYSVAGIGACQDTKIIIPATYEDKNVTSIAENAFNACTNVINIVIPESVTSIGADAFYDTAYYNNEENWENDVLYIGKYLIRAKTSINGAYTVKDGTKGVASSAFYECNNITGLTIPNSVTTMGSAVFWKCKKLENIVLSQNLTSIEKWTFYQCDNLSNIVIPDSVTSIGSSAFEYCKKLENIQMENGVISIGSKAFYECNSLTSIEIPNSVETIGSEAFWNCYSLARMDIGNGVRSIDGQAFYNCLNLESVYIIDVAAWCNISFRGSSAHPLSCAKKLYLNNELITQLVIPETVTMINAYAFFNCKTITSVIIPSTVKGIDHDVFLHCSNLTSVYYAGTAEDWSEIKVAIMNQPLMNATRYYYSETEPLLNAEGLAYDDNYWHYIDGILTVWLYEKD